MSKTHPIRPAENVARGIGAAVLAMALFSASDVIVKVLREDYGAAQIFFFRSVFALLPALVLLRMDGGVAALKTRRLGLHVFRSLLTAIFLMAFFYALRTLPLADAYTIVFAAPLFITALSVPLVGERVGPRRWAAVLVGFTGILVVLRPEGALFSMAGLIALGGTAVYAVAMLLVRRMSRTETQSALVIYLLLTGIVLSGVAMLWDWATPNPMALILMLAVGVLSGCGQIFIVRAYSIAPPATISPFQYTQMIWGVAYGYLIFADLPSPWVILGASIVIGSGLYILHRETIRATPAADRPDDRPAQ